MFETMRVFYAAYVEIAATRRLAELAKKLKSAPGAPRAAWVSPTRYHITLRFLGDIDVGLSPALVDTLQHSLNGINAPLIKLKGIGAFPSVERARVLYISVHDESNMMLPIVEKLNIGLDDLGIAAEERSYTPHMTLARLGEAFDARNWIQSIGNTDLGRVRVTECGLFRSDNAKPAAEYPAVARFGLATSSQNQANRK